jgi:hypothetical protein
MPLRLGFVAEWRKRDRLHAACTAQDERSGQQWNRKPKQPSSLFALAPDLSATYGDVLETAFSDAPHKK